MKQFYSEFFEYNYHINKDLAEQFKGYTEIELGTQVIRLANHILNAHEVWIGRINQAMTIKSPWEDFPIHTFSGRNKTLYAQSLEIIKNRELCEIITYRNFAGKEGRGKISDILTHIVNHATYHRGQIALIMRANGLEPITSDFIHFKMKL